MPPRKKATTPKVDETVVNQENPGTSEEARESTETTTEDRVPEMAPANEVDDTVRNQEAPGSVEAVDRSEPVLVSDATGTTFDVAKSQPEIVDPDAKENEARQNRIRQTEGAMNAKDLVENDEDDSDSKKIKIEFLESGLTANGRVWRVGQILELDEDARRLSEDSDGNVWYELSASQQKERYGKVFFERK